MHAKSGHDLIEDQYRPVLGAQAAQGVEVAWQRRDHVHVAGNRFDDHAGDLGAARGEHLLELCAVVVVQRQRMGRQRGGYTRRAWHAQCQRTGAGLDQQRVGVAVVAAFEFDDGVAAGEAPGQTDRAHRRLGAGAAHAGQRHRRHQIADAPGECGLRYRRRAVGQALERCLLDGVNDLGVCMTQNHRSPGTDVVDIALAVLTPHIGATGLADEYRIPADRAEGAHR